MRKVLVVDDSLSVRKVVEKALEVRGLQVLAAASGAEAITMIERDRPDVVICDVILPDKEGYQVCEYVRAHPSIAATPVLLISGIDNGTVQARAAEVRSDEVMFKPFSVEDLVRRVDKLLGGRTNGSKAPAAVAATAAPSAPVAAPSPVTPARVPPAPSMLSPVTPPRVSVAPAAPASTSATQATPAPVTATAPVTTSAPTTAAPVAAVPVRSAPTTAVPATAVPVSTAPTPAAVSAPPAPASSSRAPSAPVSSSPTTAGASVKQRLEELAGAAGVRFVVLTDREGFLIETAGDFAPDADEVAGALASCLAEASEGIGRELGQGQLVGTILEYEAGTVLLHRVGSSALLAVLVSDQGALGKVRYYVRRTVPELVRVL